MRRGSGPRRQWLLWILSVIIIVSMLCSFVATLRPPRVRRRATPPPATGIPIWTLTPTPAPATPAPPTLALPTLALPTPAATGS